MRGGGLIPTDGVVGVPVDAPRTHASTLRHPAAGTLSVWGGRGDAYNRINTYLYKTRFYAKFVPLHVRHIA